MAPDLRTGVAALRGRRDYLLVALPLAIAVAAFLAALLILYQAQADNAVERSTRAVAQAITHMLETEVGSRRLGLEALAITATQTPDAGGFRTAAEHLMARDPAWLAVTLANRATGQPLLTIAQSGGPVPVPAEMKLGERLFDGTSVVSGVHWPEAPGQMPFLVIRMPIEAPTGGRTLAAAFALPSLSQVLEAQRVADDWLVVVLDRDHATIIARSRNGEKYMGAPATPSIAAVARSAPSRLSAAKTQEGRSVYAVVQRSARLGWATVVAVPSETVWHSVRDNLIGLAGGGGLAVVLAVVLTAHVMRRIAYRQAEYEARLDRSAKEKEALLWEVHHRVRNNLQVMSSLLQIETMHVVDEAARDRLETACRRIAVIALAHEQAHASPDPMRIDLGRHIERICAGLAEMRRGPVTMDVKAEPLLCTVDQAISLGLIVNELVSSSLSHAFPGGRRGHLEVGLTNAEDGAIELVVSDDGVGLSEKSRRRSMSMRLVHALAEQVDATLDIQGESGTRVVVRARLAAHSPAESKV